MPPGSTWGWVSWPPLTSAASAESWRPRNAETRPQEAHAGGAVKLAGLRERCVCPRPAIGRNARQSKPLRCGVFIWLDCITRPGLVNTQLFFLEYHLNAKSGREEGVSMETAITVN